MQSAPPIKGRACNNPQVSCWSDALACPRDVLRSWLFEQLVGGAAMLADIGDMRLDSLDFLPEAGDPLFKLFDRQWAKILLGDLVQRIQGPAGKEVVLVHGHSVDRRGPAVNKARP